MYPCNKLKNIPHMYYLSCCNGLTPHHNKLVYGNIPLHALWWLLAIFCGCRLLYRVDTLCVFGAVKPSAQIRFLLPPSKHARTSVMEGRLAGSFTQQRRISKASLGSQPSGIGGRTPLVIASCSSNSCPGIRSSRCPNGSLCVWSSHSSMP